MIAVRTRSLPPSYTDSLRSTPLWSPWSAASPCPVGPCRCRCAITSRSRGYRSSLPRRNSVNHDWWLIPPARKRTSSYGTSSARASMREVPCTLWHRPTVRAPSALRYQVAIAIGFA